MVTAVAWQVQHCGAVMLFASIVAVDCVHVSVIRYQSVILKLPVFMMTSPSVDRNDGPLFCVVLCQVPTSSRRCCRCCTSCSVGKKRACGGYIDTRMHIYNCFYFSIIFTTSVVFPSCECATCGGGARVIADGVSRCLKKCRSDACGYSRTFCV